MTSKELLAVSDDFYYVIEEDRITHPDYCEMLDAICRWVRELRADGSWTGISPTEAMRRLHIMITRSDTDAALLPIIERALAYYRHRTADSPGLRRRFRNVTHRLTLT